MRFYDPDHDFDNLDFKYCKNMLKVLKDQKNKELEDYEPMIYWNKTNKMCWNLSNGFKYCILTWFTREKPMNLKFIETKQKNMWLHSKEINIR